MIRATVFARLGRDAEVRFTAGGDPVASLSLACSYGRKGADGKRPTQWIDAALWGARAESLAPYLTKGSAVVVGLSDVHIEEFARKDGTASAKLVARVDDVALAGDGDAKQSAPRSAAPATRPAPTRAAPATRPAPAQQTGFEDMDDSIPF